MAAIHRPVLMREVLDCLFIEDNPGCLGEGSPTSFFIDCTIGEGGHSKMLLDNFKNIKLIGIDADPSQVKRAGSELSTYKDRVRIIEGWFDEILSTLKTDTKAKLILFDFGISMFHLKLSSRGFSYHGDEDLDMRLSPKLSFSAKDLINELNEEDLADLIFIYGEEPRAKKIAEALVFERSKKKITTTSRLEEIIWKQFPNKRQNLHPATKTFQAIRIAVNDELGRILRALIYASEILDFGGSLICISFHSLEDRIVKQFFKTLLQKKETGNKYLSVAKKYAKDVDQGNIYKSLNSEVFSLHKNIEPIVRIMETARFFANTDKIYANLQPNFAFELINKKIIKSSWEERSSNRASRSAKLRAAKKVIYV